MNFKLIKIFIVFVYTILLFNIATIIITQYFISRMDSSEFENSKSNLVNMKETIPKAMPLAITKNFFNF